MSEKITPENLINNIVESLGDSHPKFFEEDKLQSVTTQFSRLFGRKKPVHHILGGGKSADVLLWRNKKISAGVLSGATVVWILFEWLNYNFLSLVCYCLILIMVVQFACSNASGLFNRSRTSVPRLVLPKEFFVDIANAVGAEVNRALKYLQDISCGANLKQFLLVAGGLFFAAIIGSWCNFLTVIYIGFVAAHTLPVLYERYEDQVDNVACNVLDQLQYRFRKVDTGFLSKISKGVRQGKKDE